MEIDSCSIQGILNRLVSDPKTFDTLLSKLVQCIADKAEIEGKDVVIDGFIDMIHRKAIAETKLTNVYADCISDMIRLLRKSVPNNQLSSKLVNKCSNFFENYLTLDPEDEYEFVDKKRKKLGNVRFCAELFIRCQVGPDYVNHILDSLSGENSDTPPSADNVEALRVFLLLASNCLDPDVEQKAMSRVAQLRETHPCKRVRLLLLDFNNSDTETVQTSSSTPSSDPPSSPSDHSFCSPPTLDLLPPASANIIPKGDQALTKKAFEKEQAERKECTVYVVGIDSAIPESDLLAYASQCGPVSKIRLCGDTSNPTVYGFFEFEYPDAARRLIRRDKTPLGSFVIQCSHARQAIRDLHGDATSDSNIRTLCFGKSSQPPPPSSSSSPTLKESTLNSSWNKERKRASRDQTAIQKRQAAKMQYQQQGSFYEQQWQGYQYLGTNSLAEAVIQMATDRTIPNGMPQRLGGLGSTIVMNTLMGQGEWEEVLQYLPDFLESVEELYRTDCLPMLIDGVQKLTRQIPHLGSSAYGRLSELLLACFRSRVINSVGMSRIVYPLEFMEGWMQFSIDLAESLGRFSLIAEVF